MRYESDVIVAGGGISGLLIASELSKELNVTILDSRESLDPQKFWVTNESCLLGNTEFKDLIDSKILCMDLIDAYRNVHTINGTSLLWKSNTLVQFLLNKITSNNGTVLAGHRFCGYRKTNSGIDVFANEKVLQGKLLIDCMGYGSPLTLAKYTVKIHGYYSIHGATLPLKKSIRPICLSNVIISDRPRYFEVFPDSSNNAHAILIAPATRVQSMKELSRDFKYIISKSEYSQYFDKSSASYQALQGIIPVGTIKTGALDNIFFYGESAQSNPAATGTLLTRMLSNYKEVSAFLIDRVRTDSLRGKSLQSAPISLSTFNRKMQFEVYKRLLEANSDTFSNYVNQLSKISDKTIHDFVYGELNLQDIITRKRIGKLLSGYTPGITSALFRSLFR